MPSDHDVFLNQLVQALDPVKEIAALALGGSRARGTAGPNSDYDLGLYYEIATPLDITKLEAAIAPLVDDPAANKLSQPGGWGPWINGGGWLIIAGRKVDLIYRDLTRVRAVIADCREGRLSMDYQPGHPHGFCSAIWLGEVALCQSLSDRTGIIAELKAQVWPYPSALQMALIGRFHWEVSFSIDNAEKAIQRQDQTHFGGCSYRALCCIAQVLFALNERYLINEKGALAEAETFPITIPGMNVIVGDFWARVGARDFHAALQLLRQMAEKLDLLVAQPRFG